MVTLTAVRTQAACLGLRKTFVMWPRCPSQAGSSQMTPEAIWSFILYCRGAHLGLGPCQAPVRSWTCWVEGGHTVSWRLLVGEDLAAPRPPCETGVSTEEARRPPACSLLCGQAS